MFDSYGNIKESYGKSPFSMGKTTINGQCSIANCYIVYQRVLWVPKFWCPATVAMVRGMNWTWLSEAVRCAMTSSVLAKAMPWCRKGHQEIEKIWTGCSRHFFWVELAELRVQYMVTFPSPKHFKQEIWGVTVMLAAEKCQMRSSESFRGRCRTCCS